MMDVFVSAAEYRAQLEVAHAQRDAAMGYVIALLAILTKHGGYSTTEQQRTMRGARALVAEQEGGK